jgi:hypothetical protein
MDPVMALNTARSIAVHMPEGSRLRVLYANADLTDAYAIAIPVDATTDPEVLARFIFMHQAPWVAWLLRVRDAVMARFGVKTTKQFREASGHRIAMFRIYERAANEIILGEDDRHLDFRVSAMRTGNDAAQAVLTLATVVHCHNRLGKIYLFVIAPFHRRVVRSALDRAACIGWPKAEVD